MNEEIQRALITWNRDLPIIKEFLIDAAIHQCGNNIFVKAGIVDAEDVKTLAVRIVDIQSNAVYDQSIGVFGINKNSWEFFAHSYIKSMCHLLTSVERHTILLLGNLPLVNLLNVFSATSVPQNQKSN